MSYTVASKPEGWKRNNWTMVSATLSYQSVTGDFDISRPIPKHNRRSLKSGASSGRGLLPRQDLKGDSTGVRKIGADFYARDLQEGALYAASRDTPVLTLARTDTKVLWTSPPRVAHILVMDCRQERT